MASPMVAGVAALAISANAQITAVDLRALLMQNAARIRPSGLRRLPRRVAHRAGRQLGGQSAMQAPTLKILGGDAQRPPYTHPVAARLAPAPP